MTRSITLIIPKTIELKSDIRAAYDYISCILNKHCSYRSEEGLLGANMFITFYHLTKEEKILIKLAVNNRYEIIDKDFFFKQGLVHEQRINIII